MFLGYSGQGKTVGMNMLMNSFRKTSPNEYHCVRVCHFSCRDLKHGNIDSLITTMAAAMGVSTNGT
jgi:Cdc6-like AAA superfamily ATPase